MAKTKEIVCVHYIAHGECDLGRDAEFYGICQHCPSYKKKPGQNPLEQIIEEKNQNKLIGRNPMKEIFDEVLNERRVESYR